MRAWVAIALVALVATACAGSPAAAPSPSAAPATVAPSASPTPSDMDLLVAAAKAEGTVKISGPRGLPEYKQILADGFTAKYGIKVEYTDAGAEAVLKQMLDTPAGSAYPWDVLVGGFDTLFSNLQPKGALAPIDPLLVAPEVKDPAKWLGGKIPYFNSAKTGVAFMKQAGQYFYVDTSKVDLAPIKSYRDLLDPRFKGQILMTGDPRDAGHGRAVFALFLQSPGLGESFIRDFVAMAQPVIPKNNTTDADRLLTEGKYLICVCNNSQGTDLLKRSPAFKKLDPHQVKEGTSTTSSFANLGVPVRVTHPNASKLYVNWILGMETGTAMAKATGVPSARADVSRDIVAAQAIPEPSWPSGSDESALAAGEAAAKLATTILGPKN